MSKPKLRLYHDGRRCSKEERCPVYVKITHIGTAAYIVTDVHLLASEWNKETESVIKHPNKTAFNRYLSSLLEEYRVKIDDVVLHTDISRYTAAKVKELLTAKPEQEKYIFWRYYQDYTEKAGKSTKRMFLHTANRIMEYEKRYDKLFLDDITAEWLTGFERHLKKRGNQHNTIVWHLQHIRTAINCAAKQGIVFANPFVDFHSLNSKPAKRALEPKELHDILLINDCKHQDALDIFKLSFYLIGMNLVDLMHLPTNAIVDGRITYVRQKLKHRGKEFSVKVEPEALELINKYRGKKRLLRFLEDEEAKPKYRQHPEKLDDAYAAIVRRVDNHLKSVRKGLTTYYARHSWATIALNHCEVSMDFIAQALGHSSAHKTTNIYITLGNKQVDEANRKVIDFVLGL